jgi:hypothetical protein
MTDEIKDRLLELLGEALREHTKDFFMTDEEIESIKDKYRLQIDSANSSI